MPHTILLQLAGILVLGICAQWLAWRLRLPSILLLLLAGILAGPVSGWLHPDALFGDLLLPMVSISVAVILYEGGLTLKLRELRAITGAFLLLITLGVAISWISGTLAAHYLLALPWPVAALLGALLVVTGPTVIGPILRHLHLRGKVGALLKWEGIIIDPVGATLAVAVFAVLQADAVNQGLTGAALNLAWTLLIGVVAGGLAAGGLILALARFWVPDALHNSVSLMLMFSAFALANQLQDESDLLAVTLMGIVLTNQRWVSIRHVVKFKESLTVLLIAWLFVILSARLTPDDLLGLGWQGLLFVAFMIAVARPLSVLLATLGSSLSWPERAFLCCMAPRGIVAAAIASVFALNLADAGYPRAMEMVPITLLVVFVTVMLYGLSAAPLARRLGLTERNPQGILFIGAHSWTRALAQALQDEGCPVFLVDSAWDNIRHARMAGLPCLYGSALAEETRARIDYAGLGRMLAMTPNNAINSLACLQYVEDFGRREVYQLPFSPASEGMYEEVPPEHRGRLLFDAQMTFANLNDSCGASPTLRKTWLSHEFDYAAFQAMHGETMLPLIVKKTDGSLQVYTVNELPNPQPGDLIISVAR